jgi:hypothetical protein
MSKLDSSCNRIICGSLRGAWQTKPPHPLQAFSPVTGRLQISARRQLMSGFNSRPRELRYVASPDEILAKVGRTGQRNGNEEDSRYGGASGARTPAHTVRIESPSRGDNGQCRRGNQQDPPTQGGKRRQKKGGGIPIHDQDIEETIVIQSLSYLNRESSVRAPRNTRETRAAMIGQRRTASQRQCSAVHRHRKTATPSGPASVASMRAQARACSESTSQNAND